MRVRFVQLDIEQVDAGELLEQDGLAFHDRLRRERPDVAQAKHRRAIRHDANQVAARREARGVQRIPDDRLARERDARRVRQREVALVDHLLRRGDRDLPGDREFVVIESGFTELALDWSGHDVFRVTAFADNDNDIITLPACARGRVEQPGGITARITFASQQQVNSNGTGRAQMNPTSRDDNHGQLPLQSGAALAAASGAAPAHRDVVLKASPDGRTVVLVEVEERFSDQHATGPDQLVRHEISVSELIQLIRAHGARL